MSAREAFCLVPWERDFLAALADELVRKYAPKFDEVSIIFPHTRPARYLRRMLAERDDLAKPCLLPAMYALPEVISGLAAQLEADRAVPRQSAHILDQAALLREAARVVTQNDPSSAKAFPRNDSRENSKLYSASHPQPSEFRREEGSGEGNPKRVTPLGLPSPDSLTQLTSDARRWLPWGLRLAALMEELFTAGLTPGSFNYLDDTVPPFAAALLERLTAIHSAYVAELNARDLTTPGYDVKIVLDALRNRHAPDASTLLSDFAGRRVILAGFHGLSGVEEVLFKRLWEEYGARIFLHSDARLVNERGAAHWSCAAHAAWLKHWSAQVYIAPETSQKTSAAMHGSPPNDEKFTFHQGYDLHSQLARLPELLPADPTESTAIVLLNSGLLMPLLHHLPRKDINISMGYPLERTSLARLAESVFKLQESRNATPGKNQASTYHWRTVLNLIRHPYLRMLEKDGTRPLQKLLARMEEKVRSGAPFIDPRALADALTNGDLAAAEDSQNAALLAKVLNLTITAWENTHTLSEAAKNLAGLADLLMTEGRDLWPRFPLDGEYLFRLSARLIPQLAQSIFADDPLDQPTLLAVLRESLRNEHVAFEADPLEGPQILGMLETRLLSFARVFILDATDDNLPGTPAADPLLPDALRREMGLPGLAERELSMAYTFNRLINSAAKAVILYQTGLSGTGLLDEKKVRSRFVEELIWKEEQRQKRLLSPNDAPLHNISFNITPAAAIERGIPKSEAAIRALNAWLKRPVSPTALDAYLLCPVQFFYSRLAGLTPPETVQEGDDPKGIGEFLHAVLQEFFASSINTIIPHNFPGPEAEKHLADIYLRILHANTDLPSSLPYASLLMLENTGLMRLMNMLRQTPPGTRILALESTLEAPIAVSGRKITLRGKLDRVDFRSAPGGSEASPRPLRELPAPRSKPLNPTEGTWESLSQEGHILILDYKSGKIPESKKAGFWNKDNPLWQAMEDWTTDAPPESKAFSALQTLASDLKSLQLPVYMYLHRHKHPELAHNAAFVDLARSGAEKPLFTAAQCEDTGVEQPDAALRALYAAFIPVLPAFVLRHLIECEEFSARPGKHCAWCPYAGLCRKRCG